jgi:hypothetical protein
MKSPMKRLQNERQLNATREKLKILEEQYEKSKNRPSGNEYLWELTLGSLGRRIKQLKEEIMWYECHACVRELSGPAVASTSIPGEASAPCTN